MSLDSTNYGSSDHSFVYSTGLLRGGLTTTDALGESL